MILPIKRGPHIEDMSDWSCEYHKPKPQTDKEVLAIHEQYFGMTKKRDPHVEQPKHYTFSKYEVIEVLEAWFPTEPLLWQVGKYIARAKHKGKELQDLKKARFYLGRKIKQLESQQDTPTESSAAQNFLVED